MSKPHVTFVDSGAGLMHLSDGSAVGIGGWLDHEGAEFFGEPTPETVRFCFSEPVGGQVIMVDLRNSAYGEPPVGRA